MDTIDRKRIEANLRRWSDSGIDPRNPDHVKAYLLCRQVNERPRVEHVLAAIESLKLKHSTATELSQDFFLVPKDNVDPAAPFLKKWLRTEKDLRARFEVPAESDFANVLIVDAGCSRERLGPDTTRMNFHQKFSKTFSLPSAVRTAVSPDPADGSLASASAPESAFTLESAAEAPDGGVSAGSASSAGPASSQVLLARTSSVLSPSAEPTATKKQRVLKMMQSDEHMGSEEVEATTVEQLVQRVKQAARANKIYQPASVGATSVHFWAAQVVGSLRAVAGVPPADPSMPGSNPIIGPTRDISAGPKSHSMLANHFPGFLLKILYAAKCWKDLKHFVPTLRDLKILGAPVPCDIEALQKFAEADPIAQEIYPDNFAAEDLTARVRFFASPLYKDFVESRATALLKAAQTATTSEASSQFSLVREISRH